MNSEVIKANEAEKKPVNITEKEKEAFKRVLISYVCKQRKQFCDRFKSFINANSNFIFLYGQYLDMKKAGMIETYLDFAYKRLDAILEHMEIISKLTGFRKMLLSKVVLGPNGIYIE